jgi:hypothetical protein
MRIQKSPYSSLGKARKKGPKLSLEPKRRIPEKDRRRRISKGRT